VRRLWQRVAFLASFGVAMVSLAAAWGALQVAWQTPTLAACLYTLGFTVVFVVSFLYLGFWVYAWDRAAGRVKREIAFYERFLQRK
jgi:hypothetical protein